MDATSPRLSAGIAIPQQQQHGSVYTSVAPPPSIRSMDIVVARYKEDVGWLNHVMPPSSPMYDRTRILVYCKSAEDAPRLRFQWQPRPKDAILSLPNVGREGHTYLRHIVDNYDIGLADVTAFIQGNPFDHARPDDLLDSLREGGLLRRIDWFENMSTNGLGVVLLQDLRCQYWTEEGRQVTETIFKELFASPAPKFIRFGAGAHFAATRDAIRFRSKAFWTRCLQFLNNGVDPIEGYAMERLWWALFDRSLVARL